jgi:UDP-glucose 4-epimerase
MKILVTDATSTLGAELVLQLLDEAAVDHVLAVGHDAEPGHLPTGEPRLTYVDADLSRPRAAHDLLYGAGRTLGIDAVVHSPLLASAHAGGSAAHSLNVESTRELLLLCERHPTVRHFLYRSVGDVYALRLSQPSLIDEDQPLEFDPVSPQWVRDRVEADVAVCARMGMSPLPITVLRCAEVLAPGTGSQLWDYLESRICLRPLGFDPMINVLSPADCVQAVWLALRHGAAGVYNIPGADTLPLSRLVRRFGRLGIPAPGPLLSPLYQLRRRTVGLEFRYDLNMRRFHFGGVLDGSRARMELGYEPRRSVLPMTFGQLASAISAR